MTGCSVEGCDREREGRGLCGMHYQRLTKRGTLADPPRFTSAAYASTRHTWSL
jgi:hypothetical protein